MRASPARPGARASTPRARPPSRPTGPSPRVASRRVGGRRGGFFVGGDRRGATADADASVGTASPPPVPPPLLALRPEDVAEMDPSVPHADPEARCWYIPDALAASDAEVVATQCAKLRKRLRADHSFASGRLSAMIPPASDAARVLGHRATLDVIRRAVADADESDADRTDADALATDPSGPSDPPAKGLRPPGAEAGAGNNTAGGSKKKQSFLGDSLRLGDFPAETRTYRPGASMDWHVDVCLYVTPQLEMIYTVSNASDARTQWLGSDGSVRSLRPAANSALLFAAGGAWHRVRAATEGERVIVKALYCEEGGEKTPAFAEVMAEAPWRR